MNNVQLLEMSKKQSTKRGTWELILHNDQTVSFDHVITCLVEICGHNEYQANQCALLTHNTKRCSIVVDKYNICSNIKDHLIEAGLTVTMKKQKRNV